ncbi:DUF6876 family protein [Chryseobacterium sp. POE27]|uniref:DUF6876 family protein n=1 Tax=Chryseobacterium sp. POE27 TaxID=3138177 RepID=UPI00321AEAC1
MEKTLIKKTSFMSIKRAKKRNSANTLYDMYKSAEDLYRFKEGYSLTQGVFDLISGEDCDWLLDLIVDEQSKLNCDIQNWHLKRIEGENFALLCSNEDGEVINQINDISLRFYFDDLFLVVKKKLICLPIESKIYS